ncbi:MAG: SIMPL domain-containing protein, partial [Anaerolineae bacterium]
MWKRILWIGLTVAALLAVALGGAWLWGQADVGQVAAQDAAAPDYSPSQIITVVGQGSTRVEPDIARVTVGVETSAATIAEAVDENQGQMDSVLAALREAGIADKDLQTTNFSISLDRYPETVVRSDEGQSQPVYRVSNMVNVTIRDLEQVGAVLDAVIGAGANNIWGVSFTIEDPTEAQAEARADAVTNARERAQALAELSGVDLGPVMAIREVVSGGGGPVAYD